MRSRNLLICVTGIDGSGKTTLARRLNSYCRELGYDSKYVYARFKPRITFPLMAIGNALFLRNDGVSESYNLRISYKKHLIGRKRFLSRLYLLSILSDYLLQLILKIGFPLALGKVVVCDRYVYDTLITDLAVDYNMDTDTLEYLAAKAFAVVPEPSLTFLVDLPEETAYSRKTDVSDINYLKDRRPLYLEMARKRRMVVLDGSKTADDVFKDARREVEGFLQQLS